MKRIDAIDVAKGIGIFCIVFGHAAPDSVWRFVFYSFHVPLFFILSGITYRNKKSKKIFVIGKVKRLLIPYYIFSVISILVYYLMGKILLLPGDTRILPNLIGMLYANSNSGYMTWNRPLWFLPCLFLTNLGVDIFETVLQKYGNKLLFSRWVFVFFAWGIGIAINVNIKNLCLPFHFESAVFLSGFFELGIILATIASKERLIKEGKKKNWIYLVVALICAGVLALFVNGATDVRIHKFGRYPVCLIFTSLAFSVVTLIVSVKIDDNKWLVCMGRSSLAIMLMHKFPILFFQEIVPVVKVWLEKTDTFLGGVCGLAVTVITVLMCMIAEKIIDVFFPWMLGKTKRYFGCKV